MPFPRIYGLPRPHTISTPGENWIAFDFKYNDASPEKCFTIPKDYRIITAQIVITVPFNDAASKLKIGTLAQADKYMTDTENVPSEIGENESNPYELLANDTDVYVTIIPATATQGEGTVLIEFDQPFP
jgi:hypothetical protein